MDIITPMNARIWSKLGSRGTFGTAILELAKVKEDLMVLSADLGNSSGLDRFKSNYPDRFINTGIAEQNMIGIASGIAKNGFTVFATSFAPFISMRSSEQIRMNLGYMQSNVKAVGLGSGLSMTYLGNSHYGIEDVAVMRAIPNMTVVCPADGAEIVKCVFATAEYKGPIYIRLTGAANNPIVYKEDYKYEIGKAVAIKEGTDVAFIAAGTMVYQVLRAAELLEEQGINSTVIDMHTIKPLDNEAIDRLLKHRLIVTVEEHNVIGGLGSAVAECLAPKANKPPHIILGIGDFFPHAGDYQYLLEQCGLTVPQIVNRVREQL
ncbi:MAG: transketolase family protein [Ruminiclostridium sp.]